MVSRTERQTHGRSEHSQRLVQAAEVFVPPANRPPERAMLTLDHVSGDKRMGGRVLDKGRTDGRTGGRKGVRQDGVGRTDLQRVGG